MVNHQNVQSEISFMLAVETGQYNKVKNLIAEGVDITAEDNNGNTALILACKGNHFNIVRMLLEEIEPKIEKYSTSEGYNKGLIKKYDYLQKMNHQGETALLVAVKNFGEKHILSESLREHGASLPNEAGQAASIFITQTKNKIEQEIEIHKILNPSNLIIKSLEEKKEGVENIRENLSIAEGLVSKKLDLRKILDKTNYQTVVVEKPNKVDLNKFR